MNLRSPIQGMFAYPTLVLFCEGKAGIAAAKALIEATPDSGGLNFPLRQDVRMYYRVSFTPLNQLIHYTLKVGSEPAGGQMTQDCSPAVHRETLQDIARILCWERWSRSHMEQRSQHILAAVIRDNVHNVQGYEHLYPRRLVTLSRVPVAQLRCGSLSHV